MKKNLPLVDRFGRIHTDLRISVTDRCNLRCYYCMPTEGVPFRPHNEVLRFEEIERFVRVAARLGVHDVRLTGGEPLVRKHIGILVEMLAKIDGIENLAITTNGVLLAEMAALLKSAGLDRLNISLDTLDREKFVRITHHDELDRVFAGIDAARQAGFEKIKLNALAIRGLTEEDAVPLARFARQHDIELRFIEFMPLDGDSRWDRGQVLPGEEIRRILTKAIGPMEPIPRNGSMAPATEYRFLDGGPSIGLIPSVSRPFCHECGRLRLTADGRIRNCLFATEEHDARKLIRSEGTDEQLAQLIRDTVNAKKQERGTDSGHFPPSDRTMHQIGG